MKFGLKTSIIVPALTGLAAIFLTGCVDEGRYYHVETRVENARPIYDRDAGPRFRPARHPDDYRGYRPPPPPPSIYDDRDDRDYYERRYDRRYERRVEYRGSVYGY